MISDSDLTEEELVELSRFIKQNGRVSPTGAVGLTTAVISAPGLVEPGEWLGALWGEPDFADAEHAERILKSVVMVHHSVQELLLNDDFSFVPGPEAPDMIEEFCRGYLRGVQLSPEWKRDRKAMILPSIFAVLAGEASPSAAMTEPGDDLPGWLARQREGLRDYVAALYHRFAFH